MGFLSQDPNAGAAQFGSDAIGWQRAATVASGLGPVISGFGQYQQSQYQASVAQNNAAIMRTNADNDLQAGSFEESVAKLNAGKTVSAQRAGMAANGVDVNVGSAAQVQDDTQKMGLLDAALVHFNAAKQAYSDLTQANTLDTQAKLDKTAGGLSLLSGISKGADSYISANNSLNAKWSQFRQYGVGT